MIIGRIYGELSGSGESKLSKHLRSCAHCRAKLEQLETARKMALSNLQPEDPPDHLDRIILAAARDQTRALRKPERFILLKPLPAVLAVTAVILAFTTLYTRRYGGIDMKSHLEETNRNGLQSRAGETHPATRFDAELSEIEPRGIITGDSEILSPPVPEGFSRLKKKSMRQPVPGGHPPPAPSMMQDKTVGRTEMEKSLNVSDLISKAGYDEAFRSQDRTIPEDDTAVSGFDTAPIILQRTDPPYPEELRGSGIQGAVILEILVLDTGETGAVEILRSLHPRCDEAAEKAVRTWIFRPAHADGYPVEAKLSVVIQFTDPG